jgi:molybdopterin synthase catalytic subunit
VRALVVEITEKPINIDDIKSKVWSANCGALIEFQGLVRDHDHDRSVTRLEYEGHESAQFVVNEICQTTADRFPKVRIGVSHRLGALAIGDLAFYVVTAAAHREEAFEVNRLLVEEVKEKIPVWKNQIFADGSNEWVNSA